MVINSRIRKIIRDTCNLVRTPILIKKIYKINKYILYAMEREREDKLEKLQIKKNICMFFKELGEGDPQEGIGSKN